MASKYLTGGGGWRGGGWTGGPKGTGGGRRPACPLRTIGPGPGPRPQWTNEPQECPIQEGTAAQPKP